MLFAAPSQGMAPQSDPSQVALATPPTPLAVVQTVAAPLTSSASVQPPVPVPVADSVADAPAASGDVQHGTSITDDLWASRDADQAPALSAYADVVRPRGQPVAPLTRVPQRISRGLRPYQVRTIERQLDPRLWRSPPHTPCDAGWLPANYAEAWEHPNPDDVGAPLQYTQGN